jgi:hypothetical protein
MLIGKYRRAGFCPAQGYAMVSGTQAKILPKSCANWPTPTHK